jgi:hypothetical protein
MLPIGKWPLPTFFHQETRKARSKIPRLLRSELDRKVELKEEWEKEVPVLLPSQQLPLWAP